MVAQSTIDRQIDLRESTDFTADLKNFTAAQPYLADYLSGEDTAAFTETEQELLYFAVLVIYNAIREEYGAVETVTGDAISAAEEANFARLQEQSSRDFRDRLNVFFTDTPEEELLAFVEDLLMPDEEHSVTKEGREPLFVTLKTCLDVLLPRA